MVICYWLLVKRINAYVEKNNEKVDFQSTF